MPLQNSAAKLYFFFIIATLIFQCNPVFSQETGDLHNHEGNHTHGAQHNEISAGLGVSYSSEYKSFDPAFHFHAIKAINSFIGIGAGYERIFAQEVHQSLSLMVNFHPFPHVDFNIGTGFGLPAHDEPWTIGLHAETSYTWPVGEKLHLGPMIDFGWSEHGYHLATGIHFGFDL